MLLKVEGVTKHFGGLVAVNDLTFHVEAGETVGLVGPNGAGKTTLLNLISGIYHPDSGRITLDERDISSLSSDKICRMGVGRTFQIPQPFLEMTAVDNVVVGILFGKPRRKISIQDARDKAVETLRFLDFPREANVLAKELMSHELKVLELAKALATAPKLILLDEVTTGLNPKESSRTIELIEKISQTRVTIVMVEHIMRVIMGVCDRIVVLNHGEKIAEGSPEEIVNHGKVIEVYLGDRYKLRSSEKVA